MTTSVMTAQAAACDLIVEASGLHTYYGASHVLHGVDFRVSRGETVSLLGRNGMGKTTTLRSILGFVPPKQGVVRINGRDMTGAKPYQVIRQHIAYVPEGRGIFSNLTVREHLLMPARPGANGRMNWTFERVMDTFPRLSERLNHLGGQLSGGEQQMLAIGRALMTNPDLLILDEATEGLAPLIREEIWRIIRTIKDDGIATVIVDKNVNVLLGLADRNVILVKGQVVFDGSSDELRDQPEILAQHIGV
ncbi:MAG TPA: ABC transporter ATP-binding protein [Candidatus Competibacteraceae bacterium]|nr:ABC transporter ATP-binding protein [Candidatus Competibacteraceae bacterium]